MTTDNGDFQPSETPKPDKLDTLVDMDQLPLAQRHYIHANEVGKYKGFRIYTGTRGATYIDETEQERYVPYQAVDLKAKWVKDFITNDPETGKARTKAPPFEITTEDENSGEMVKLTIEGLYHVPNHGPNEIEYEDGSIRPAGQSYTDADGNKLQQKKNMHDQAIIRTSNHALVLNGDKKIPATAQKGSVHLSDESDSPIQALYRDANGKQMIIFTPKERKRRKDTFWAYQRAAFEDADSVLTPLLEDIENVDNWNDSKKVIALVGLTGFRHGSTGKPRRLPANAEEKENVDSKNYTGERTGIGAGSLIASEVNRSKDSVTFKFTGKEDVPQEHEYNDSTEEGRRILAIVDSALKGKGPEDRLFATNTKANNMVLRSLVPDPTREISISTEERTFISTPHKLEMKNLRTHVGTALAKKELANRIGEFRQSISGKSDKAIELAFTTLRKEIGLVVGAALGHKGRVELTKEEKEQVEQGIDVERTWKVKAAMALNNYIDPAIWKDVMPEGTVAKLMKTVNFSRSTNSTLQKASVPFLKAKGKYKGRTGGITPDWTMKVPGEERDIDEWAEARGKKAEERQWGIKPVGGQHIAKTWIGSLADKGFTYPLIKQVIGSQMWFAQDGIDYVANLGINENELVTSVEKATFTYNKPSVSYAPSGRNNHNSKRKSSGKQGERYQGDIIDDEEDDYSNV